MRLQVVRLLAGNSFISLAGSEEQIIFFQQSPKLLKIVSENFIHALLLFLGLFLKISRWVPLDLMIKTTSRFLVYFFDYHCTTTTWNLLIWCFMKDMDIRRRMFLALFELEWNPGKVACIWHIERVQIDAIKFERTQIHFFSDVFTADVVDGA